MGYRVFDHTFLFFIYIVNTNYPHTYIIHIKNIYLYIVVPVNCGPGKYISFISLKLAGFYFLVILFECKEYFERFLKIKQHVSFPVFLIKATTQNKYCIKIANHCSKRHFR